VAAVAVVLGGCLVSPFAYVAYIRAFYPATPTRVVLHNETGAALCDAELAYDGREVVPLDLATGATAELAIRPTEYSTGRFCARACDDSDRSCLLFLLPLQSNSRTDLAIRSHDPSVARRRRADQRRRGRFEGGRFDLVDLSSQPAEEGVVGQR